MKEKNYIESVTNLERTSEMYVPKKLFDELLDDYTLEQTDWLLASHDGKELDECVKELNDVVMRYNEKAQNEEVSLYTVDINAAKSQKTLKRPINVCPYCGDKMELAWSNSRFPSAYRSVHRCNNNSADAVAYKCRICGGSSPDISVTTAMFDESIVAQRIGRHIEDSIKEMEALEGSDEE